MPKNVNLSKDNAVACGLFDFYNKYIRDNDPIEDQCA